MRRITIVVFMWISLFFVFIKPIEVFIELIGVLRLSWRFIKVFAIVCSKLRILIIVVLEWW